MVGTKAILWYLPFKGKMEDYQAKLSELNKKWQEAVTKESSIREAAFLPVTLDISGIEVKQFAPIHYMYLDFSQSPFLNRKRAPDPEDIVRFLWVVSVDFKAFNDTAKNEFESKCLNLDYLSTCDAIDNYLMDAFIDMPPAQKDFHTKEPRIPYIALVCSYIDMLAHQYGWKDDEILQMPFARIYQYVRAIEARTYAMHGKDAHLINNLSDNAKREIRLLTNQYLQAKAKAD